MGCSDWDSGSVDLAFGWACQANTLNGVGERVYRKVPKVLIARRCSQSGSPAGSYVSLPLCRNGGTRLMLW